MVKMPGFQMRPEDKEKYLLMMFGTAEPKLSQVRNALKTALDIRKFEIEMYWKRATYFWAFIAAIFAGFFWVVQQMPLKEHIGNIGFCFASMGAVASWCWLLVLRGSKFWQENWEKHVDYLEDEVHGQLYKTILSGKGIDEYSPLHSYPFSVSRVNTLLSFYIFIFWICALLYLSWSTTEISPSSTLFRILLVLVSLGFIGSSFSLCKTNFWIEIFDHNGASFVRRNKSNNPSA